MNYSLSYGSLNEAEQGLMSIITLWCMKKRHILWRLACVYSQDARSLLPHHDHILTPLAEMGGWEAAAQLHKIG